MKNNNFLSTISEKLFSEYGHNLSKIIIVFPSRRAHVFFTQELSKIINDPIWLPKFYSIEDLVFQIGELNQVNKLELFLRFYNLYNKHINDPQPIDQCYKWATVLLEDFNELDKSNVDYIKLFKYLSNIKRLDTWDLDLNQETEFATNYLLFFDKLKILYESLTKELFSNRMAYSGLAQRKLANKPSLIVEWMKIQNCKKIIFVGLDALTQSQEVIIDYLLDRKLCDIYWDTDEYFLKHTKEESAKFLRKYKKKWPALFTDIKNDFLGISKSVNIVGVSKNITQAKILGNLLSDKKYNIENMTRVAIILPNESLLPAVLESLPPNIESINVTMGYKLFSHPIMSIYYDILKLYNIKVNTVSGVDNINFETTDILNLLENQYFKSLIQSSESIDHIQILTSIQKTGLKYLNQHELIKLFSNYSSIFLERVFLTNITTTDLMINLLAFITSELLALISDNKKSSNIEIECLFEIDKNLKLLAHSLISLNQKIDIKTFSLFFNQLIKSQKLQFIGEPLRGIQIMGLLEARTIDFDEVFILSANEGHLPPSSKKNSFIPIDIKLEFSIRTYLDDDAIYANHFFNLIKRPKEIQILYNNDTSSSSFGSGEKSRFLQQLIYELKVVKNSAISINEKIISDSFIPERKYVSHSIKKDNFVLDKINKLCESGLSASSINSYNYCQKEFYFQKILNLKKDESKDEKLDQMTVGLLVHDILKKSYTPNINKELTINMVLSMKKELPKYIKESLFEQNIQETNRGKNLLIIKAVERIIKNFFSFEISEIKKGNKIIVKWLDNPEAIPPQQLNLPTNNLNVNIWGVIDRIDLYNNSYRIIDYKTGNFNPKEIQCNDMSEIQEKPKLLQLLLYALLFHKQNPQLDRPLFAGIINLRSNNFQFQTCKINKIINIDQSLLSIFEKNLADIVLEICNPEIPFKDHITDDNCRFCN